MPKKPDSKLLDQVMRQLRDAGVNVKLGRENKGSFAGQVGSRRRLLSFSTDFKKKG